MLKIAFTAPFPVEELKPHIILSRKIDYHPSSWIQVLSIELSKYEDVDLHLVTVSTVVPRSQIIKKGNITYHIIKVSLPGLSRSLQLASCYFLFFFPVFQMVCRLKAIKPDIVHGHGTEGPFSLAAVYSGFRNVISIQGIISEIVKVAPSMGYRITQYLERHTLRKAIAINAKTEFSISFANRINPHAQIYFIEASIRDSFWKNPIPPPARNLFYVGSLIERKGIKEWLDAFGFLSKHFPNLTGYIIGSGTANYERMLKSLVNTRGLNGRIQFTGMLKSEKIIDLFSKGGVFCLPSHIENSPNTVMEAMAAGLPVVATKVGNVGRMVENGKSGFLVEKQNVSSMINALATIFNNQNLHLQFGQRGREIASKRWMPEIIAQKHIQMYKDLIDAI